jgi:hypothetical protein
MRYLGTVLDTLDNVRPALCWVFMFVTYFLMFYTVLTAGPNSWAAARCGAAFVLFLTGFLAGLLDI